MKKTIIATAVSAALMAPVAAQAEADVTVYGRIHQGIKLVNPEVGDSTTNFVGIGSRFGIKASSDVGNGMTVSAQYEFKTVSDTGNGPSDVEVMEDDMGVLQGKNTSGITNRIAKIGISGGFGSVDLGQQWGAYYNLVGVHVDPTFNVGGGTYYFGDSSTYGPLRTGNTIKYSNSFGPVSLEVDARLDDSGNEGGDGHAAAASIAVNDNITLAAGVDSIQDGVEHTGAAIKFSLGDYWASIASHKADPDDDKAAEPSTTQLWVGGSFGNTSAMIGMGSADMGGMDSTSGNDPSDVTLGVYHSLGGGLGLIYEGHSADSDGKGKDKTTHLFGIRMDF